MNDAAAKPQPVEMPEAEGGRERSTIGFPYLDLDDSVEIAKAVYTLGGSTCQWDQLAAHLNAAANGGGFRARLQTAKMFGLLNYDRGTVTLTSLGTRLSDPTQERSARAEAFLKIPLYNRVHEDYKNAVLPPSSGLETAMVNMGVSPKQKSKARQVFERSAKEAGFFEFGNTRLVMPSMKAGTKVEVIEEEKESDKDKEEEKSDKPARKQLDPLIEGLIQKLPDPETQWDLQGRRKWLLAALNIFDLMYTDSDESKGSLKIDIEKSSAK